MERRPKPKNAADAEFLALGEGAHMWLSEAAAAGSTKMRVKMNQALTLAKLFDPGEVDWALGHAAVHSRFAEADLASILDHHATARTGRWVGSATFLRFLTGRLLRHPGGRQRHLFLAWAQCRCQKIVRSPAALNGWPRLGPLATSNNRSESDSGRSASR